MNRVPDMQTQLKRARMLHARLLWRINRRFQTRTETYAVGPLRLPFTRVADPDLVLDQIVEEQDRREKVSGARIDGNELHLPYWAELWDSAIGIGTYLADQADLRFAIVDLRLNTNASAFDRRSPSTDGGKTQIANQKSILDLGCGMGFTGMVAAAMGARVLFADLEADCLLFARLNSIRWFDQVRTRRLNWQTDRLGESFDLILGADVLYDRTQWEYLEPFFDAHLKPNGKILLGEPGRQTGDQFPDWITQRNWKLKHLEQRIPTREKPIRIFSLERTGS